MKKLFLTCFALLLFSSLEAQSFKILPMAYDSPFSQQGDVFRYDKLDHFTGSALLTMAIPTRKYNLDLWLSFSAGLLYEINDGFDWHRTSGFSRIDMIANVTGAIFGMWLKDLLWHRGIYILVNRNGIAIKF